MLTNIMAEIVGAKIGSHGFEYGVKHFVNLKSGLISEIIINMLELEKDNLNFLRQEYRNGKVQYLDLITGYNNFSDAEIKFYSAASSLENLKYTILYHQGKLYEEILK